MSKATKLGLYNYLCGIIPGGVLIYHQAIDTFDLAMHKWRLSSIQKFML